MHIINCMNLHALRRQSRFRVFGSMELVSTWLRLQGQGFRKFQAFKPASRINDAFVCRLNIRTEVSILVLEFKSLKLRGCRKTV